MALTPHHLASILSEEQLELLAEFADEFEDDDHADHFVSQQDALNSTSANASRHSRLTQTFTHSDAHPKHGGKAALNIILAAQQALRKRRDDLPAFSGFDKEWNSELDTEVDENDKSETRIPAVPTRQEMRHILRVSERKERDHLVIRTFYATGVRRSELEAVKLADLYLKELKILIRSGKGDKDRYVLIDKKTAQMLDDFTYGRALDDPIFDIEDQQMNRIVKKYAKEAGIVDRYKAMGRNVSAHCLRHAYATHLWESGIDVFILRDLLGHRFLGTTRRYIAIGVGRVLSDYEAHHPLCDEKFCAEED